MSHELGAIWDISFKLFIASKVWCVKGRPPTLTFIDSAFRVTNKSGIPD